MSMHSFVIRDEGGLDDPIEGAGTLDEAYRIAKAGAEKRIGGFLETPETTVWVHEDIVELDASGETVATRGLTTVIEPPAPECLRGRDSHEWTAPYLILGGLPENPGVEGHGGSVQITEVCMHCATTRHRDGWAQDPATGEQGLDSVRYTREHAEQIEQLNLENELDERGVVLCESQGKYSRRQIVSMDGELYARHLNGGEQGSYNRQVSNGEWIEHPVDESFLLGSEDDAAELASEWGEELSLSATSDLLSGLDAIART